MKKLITVIALAFLSFATMAQKIGHVNAQAIMVEMTEYKAAETEMARFSAEKEKELQMFYTIFQNAQKEFEKEMPTLTEEIKQQRYQELMQKQQNIEAKQGEYQQEIQTKNQQLLESIMTKVREAIAKVAKENGYTYVFDDSNLLYFGEADSLDASVKKSLGISAE